MDLILTYDETINPGVIILTYFCVSLPRVRMIGRHENIDKLFSYVVFFGHKQLHHEANACKKSMLEVSDRNCIDFLTFGR